MIFVLLINNNYVAAADSITNLWKFVSTVSEHNPSCAHVVVNHSNGTLYQVVDVKGHMHDEDAFFAQMLK